jgi:cytochrome c-type biogenesis protein CcmF
MIVAMAIGPMLAWKRGDLTAAAQRLWAAFGGALFVALVVAWATGGEVASAVGLALSAWLILGAFCEFAERTALFRQGLRDSWRRAVNLPRSAIGAMIAHAGVGVLVAGVTGASLWVTESVTVMRPGDSKTVAGYVLTLRGVEPTIGPNYKAQRATVDLVSPTGGTGSLYPEKRSFNVSGQVMTHAAIRTTGYDDIYVALGDADGKGGWTVRAWRHPLVPWIWIGALIMAFGGMVSLADRRLRVGAPTRAAAAVGGTAPAR